MNVAVLLLPMKIGFESRNAPILGIKLYLIPFPNGQSPDYTVVRKSNSTVAKHIDYSLSIFFTEKLLQASRNIFIRLYCPVQALTK